MFVASLFDKLREHELEINRLAVQESEDKHNKGITLKACNHKHQPDSSGSDEENISLLSRKISKFLKKRQASKRYGSKKPILINILAMTVENRVISRPNVPIMKSKKRLTSRRRKREKLRRPM